MTYNRKVIKLPEVEVWSFWDFQFAEGANPIADWYNGELSEEAQFTFDALLKNIYRVKNHSEWGCFRGFLQGKLQKEKIWEFGFKSDGRHYRLLCIFGAKRKQVIILVGCYHKNKAYTPRNALNSAYTRSRAISEGKAGCCERKIKIDR